LPTPNPSQEGNRTSQTPTRLALATPCKGEGIFMQNRGENGTFLSALFITIVSVIFS